MKIKTSEATGLQLDWGLAEIMRLEPELALHECYRHGVAVSARPSFKSAKGLKQGFSHTDPAVCMGLIKKLSIHGVSLADFSSADSGSVEFCCEADFKHHSGDTLEQAVARCFLEVVLGKVFEVPDELGVQS